MIQPDQELALRHLARSIRLCVEALGPTCTAHLMATAAIDLAEAKGPADDGEPSPAVSQLISA
jgi:hypothetical protein